jgi:hypothetical protein
LDTQRQVVEINFDRRMQAVSFGWFSTADKSLLSEVVARSKRLNHEPSLKATTRAYDFRDRSTSLIEEMESHDQ